MTCVECEKLKAERDEQRGRADALAARVLDPTEYDGQATGIDLIDRLRGIYVNPGGERRFGSSAINREAAAEIERQRGRAERAETRERFLNEARTRAVDDAAAMAAEVEQLRAKLAHWQEVAADYARKASESYRTGWADGARATREACAVHVRGEWGHWPAERIRALPLPVCPEWPSATKAGESPWVPATEAHAPYCQKDKDHKGACAPKPTDAGTGAVTSGEATPCAGCLALLERAAEMLADVQEEPDGWQEWVADREKHMHAQADAIKAAVAEALSPLTDWADGIAPTGCDSPTCGRCGEFVVVRSNCDWDDGDVCDLCASELASVVMTMLRSGADAPGAGKP